MNNMLTQILVEEVMNAVHKKATDFRVMNLLLYKMRGTEVKIKLISKK